MSVNGSPLDVIGQAKVELHLGKGVFQTKVIVVSPLIKEAILGLYFLQNNSAIIDIVAAQLCLGDIKWPIKLYLHAPIWLGPTPNLA